MTADIHRFCGILLDLGITSTEIKATPKDIDKIQEYNGFKISPISTIIRLERGFGYAGFYHDFYFDTNGKYLGNGIWE